MFGNGRKTIGVFVQQVNEEYQNILCKSISNRAKELNYNVAIFTNFGGYSQEAYDNGERLITNLPIYEDLDGIIIMPDTMHLKKLEEEYHKNIIKRAHCPVVSVRGERSNYYNVLVDNDIILEEIILHFIKDHKFTRVNFLSGPEGHPEVEKRVKCYKRILQANGLPVEEDRIYYGDLWKYEGNKAVEHWLSNDNPLERPQAIICANDIMAITVCKALADRGVSVPEEIAVSGCDDIEEAEDFNPAITSVRQPTAAMGKEAVDKIHRYLLGEAEPKNSYISTYKSIFRASCGCKKHWYHETSERKHLRITSRDTMQNELIRIAQMSTDLTGVTELEEAISKISGYWFEYESISHFILCLRKDWNSYSNTSGERNEMIMKSGFRNKFSYNNIRLSETELIPPILAEDHPVTYYFALLHYREHCYGYIGFSFENNHTNMLTLQPWLNIVSSVLESVRVHMEMQRLLYRLEDMSIRDELTGLFNRRVLDTLGLQCLKQCVKDNTMLMIFTCDMDKLKFINDNFGHSNGDIAIKVVADALMEAAGDDEICIRLGGDEFMAIGMDYDDHKANYFVNRFVEEINKFNKNNRYGFDVYVSYGWNLILPDENTTLESCFSAADSRMYQQKYNKVSNNIRANLIS